MPIIGAPLMYWQCDGKHCGRAGQFKMTLIDVPQSNPPTYYLSSRRDGVIVDHNGNLWYRTKGKIYCANHSAEM